jgi:hypothetical protein
MIVKNLQEFNGIVTERDSYICAFCHKDFNFSYYFDEDGINQYVCADHIQTKGAGPELKFETDNGRTVCLDCHNKRHSNF